MLWWWRGALLGSQTAPGRGWSPVPFLGSFQLRGGWGARLSGEHSLPQVTAPLDLTWFAKRPPSHPGPPSPLCAGSSSAVGSETVGGGGGHRSFPLPASLSTQPPPPPLVLGGRYGEVKASNVLQTGSLEGIGSAARNCRLPCRSNESSWFYGTFTVSFGGGGGFCKWQFPSRGETTVSSA